MKTLLSGKSSEKVNISRIQLLRRKLEPLYLPVCFLSFFILDLSFRYIYNHLFTTGLFSYYPMVFSFFWSLLLTSIIGVIPGAAKRITMMVLILIFGIFSIAHAVVYNIFNNFFSFSDFVYLGDGVRFFSFTYLRVRKLLVISVLVSIFMMGVAAWLSAAGDRAKRKIEVTSCIATILLSAVAIFLVHSDLKGQGERQHIGWSTALAEEPEGAIYADFTDVNQSMGISGIYQYTARNLAINSGVEQWISTSAIYEKLDASYIERKGKYNIENEMTEVFAGKNLIYIMLESIDTWMIEEEYMPELYSLQQRSINFVNHYTPLFINAGTFNTEFTAVTGLLTPTSGAKKTTYTGNDFSWSLPSLFREAGYSANSFHSADPIIYDRGNIHRSIGFENYLCWYNLGMESYMRDSELLNGFNKMVAQEPFFDFIITYSGHGPYTDEMEAISKPHYSRAVDAAQANGIIGDDKNTLEYYHALAHAMETDAFIGGLMDKLEESGLLDDTVIVLFTDHYCKYMTDTEYMLGIKGVSNTDLLCNTPFMIYSSDTESREVKTYTSTIDIFPTIVNMFGLNADLTYFVGDDIFGESHHNYVMFRNYSWYDGETYYSADYSGEITEEIASRTAEVMERVNLSWDTLRSDYFKHLLKNKK